MFDWILGFDWWTLLGFLPVFAISFGVSGSKTTPQKVETWTPEQQELFKNYLMPLTKRKLGYTKPAVPEQRIWEQDEPWYDFDPATAGEGERETGGPAITGRWRTIPGTPAVNVPGEGVTRYPSNMYVSTLPEEQTYLSAAEQLAAQIGKPAYEISPEISERYFEEAIRPLAMREYEQVTRPAVKEAFAGPGYWGTARAQAETTAAENLATSLTAQKAGIVYQDELARRDALEAAAGRKVPELTALGSAGQYARAIAEQKVASDMQRWLVGEEVEGVSAEQYSPWLQLAFSLMGLQPYEVGTTGKAFGLGFSISSGAMAGAS